MDNRVEEPVEVKNDTVKVEQEPYNAFEAVRQEDARAANFAQSSDPVKTAKIRELAIKYGSTRFNVENNFEDYSRQFQVDQIVDVLHDAPETSAWLNDNPLDAPIVSKRAKEFADVEKEWLRLRNSTTEGFLQKSRLTDAYKDTSAGFRLGLSVAEEGALYAKYMENPNNKVDEETAQAYKEEQEQLRKEGDTEGFFGSAANFAGTMIGGLKEGARGATYGALAGSLASWGAATGALATPLAPAAALFVGGATIGAAVDSTYKIEAGQQLKTLLENGVPYEQARWIASGVGSANALVEMAGIKVLGAAYKPIVNVAKSYIAKELPSVIKSKTMADAFKATALAYVGGGLGEVATETWQEMNSIIGESIGSSLVGKEGLSVDEAGKRLADTAIATAKGMAVLGLFGSVPLFAYKARQVKQAEQTKEFFTALEKPLEGIKAEDIAPDVSHEIIARQADANGVPTLYIDAEKFNEVVLQKNLTANDLQTVLPGITQEELTKKALNKEDIEIKTADYAMNISNTDFGTALIDHIRTSPDALSAADAKVVQTEYRKNLRDIISGNVSEADIDNKVSRLTPEERQQFQDLSNSMLEDLANTGAYRSSSEARANAKYGAWLVTNLAKRTRIPMDKLKELAPRIVGSSNAVKAQAFNEQIVSQSDAIRKQYEGTDKWMKSPSGKPTNLAEDQWLAVRTPAFKNWFGDWENDPANASKVVDENGEPIVVYHGTRETFNVFMHPWEIDENYETPEDGDGGNLGIGFYFTKDKSYARKFSGNKEPIGVFLNARNIVDVNDKSVQDKIQKIIDESEVVGEPISEKEAIDEYADSVSADGVVGVGVGGFSYGASEIKVVDPTQIKSATRNNGNYDQNNPDIYQQVRIKPAPKKTRTVFKLMRIKRDENGKVETDERGNPNLYPLYIDSNNPVQIGKWYDADSPDFSMLENLAAGDWLVDVKTGKATSFASYAKKKRIDRQAPTRSDINYATENGLRWIRIKSTEHGSQTTTAKKRYGVAKRFYNLGINGSNAVSEYALRPGWHAGTAPSMTQVGIGKDRNIRADDQVWVEGRVPMDINYDSKKYDSMKTSDGDMVRMPVDGTYTFATNPKKAGGGLDWVISGAFKPVRIMSDAEAYAEIERQNNEETYIDSNGNRKKKSIIHDFRRQGNRMFNANTFELESLPKSTNVFLQRIIEKAPKEVKDAFDQIAYHGTPYTFDKFTLEHIGEGEGAQAHGWGLYFTLSRSTAEQYRDHLTDTHNRIITLVNGKEIDFDEFSFLLSSGIITSGLESKSIVLDKETINKRIDEEIEYQNDYIDSLEKGYKEALEAVSELEDKQKRVRLSADEELELQGWKNSLDRSPIDARRESIEKLESYRNSTIERKKIEFEGRLYEVEIPDDEYMLFEDKPLYDQPDYVREKAYEICHKYGFESQPGFDAQTGREFYDKIAMMFEGDDAIQDFGVASRKASELLSDYGIEGIRYNGRRDGECAVVFSDSAVEILKYMQRAYHGSPYVFDKFSLDHIGKGEGNQVHGRGLYFALNRNVAEGYKNELTGSRNRFIDNFKIDGIQFDEYMSKLDKSDKLEHDKYVVMEMFFVNLNKNYRDSKNFIDFIRGKLDIFKNDNLYHKDIYQFVKDLTDRVDHVLKNELSKGGRVYEVSIPEDNVLIREESMFSEQPEFVRDALKKLVKENFTEQSLSYSVEYNKESYDELAERLLKFCNEKDKDNKLGIAVDLRNYLRNPTMYGYSEKTKKSVMDSYVKTAKITIDELRNYFEVNKNQEWFSKESVAEFMKITDSINDIVNLKKRTRSKSKIVLNGKTGREIYNELANEVGDEDATEMLSSYGIKGNRYKGMTDGECAVIWDEDSIKILEYFEKLNKNLDDDIEKSNANAPRGSYQPSTNTITLTPNCDESTFAHEMGHWYLESLINMSTVDGVAISVKEDVKTILNEFGLDSVDAWGALSFQDREILHERFASWVEDYLATGKAPTKQAEGFFRRLGAFIRKAYRIFASKTREALNERYRQQFGMELPELSDEMKRVLDRMIASEDDLLQAEQAEGIQPLFDSKPEDMSDAQWEQLQYERDEAENEGVEKIQAVRMKDEKWYTKARSSTLRKIQQQGAEVRDSIRKEVEDSVNSMPGVVAYNAMKQGGKNVGIDNMKFDPDALSAAGFNAVQVAKLRSLGLCKIGGMTPSAVRSALQPFASFDSDKKMVAAIVEGSNKEDLIEKITTRRCLKEHSELFNEQKRDALITEALHNEARGRMIAHELAYLANDKNGRSRIFKEAARRTAMDIVSQSPLKNVTVKKFLAAESRASRQAFDALKAGNRAGAIVAKRAQLVNHEAALMAIDLEKQIRSLKDIKTRIFKADKKLAKTHDIDIINVARYVMTNNGIGATMPEDGDAMTAVKFVEKMEKYDPTKYELFRQIIDDNSYKGNVDFFEYKAGDALRVIEDVKSLYRMAAEAKSVYLEGKKLEREAVIDELNTTIAKGGYKEYEPGTKRVVSSKEKAQYNLMGILAKTARVENFCRAMDGGSLGAFSRYIYNPIATAASKYRNENAKYQKRLANLIVPMQKAWADVRDIEAPELGYTFATKAELIGAILHTGNKSNKTKLLAGGRGRNNPWCTFVEMPDGSQYIDTTKWDTFFSRICNDGTITQQDMNVVQAIWDSLEDTKVLAQKAFKQMYGYNFEEVEATELVTPWKTYRGGYIPAKTEKYLVAENQTFEKLTESGKEDYLSMMPVKKPGFSESRVERYTKPLVLDVGMVSSHIAEVMRFSMIAPTATEVAKILSDKSFKESMDAINPHLISELIAPWLKRSYEQKVSTGDTGFFSKQINKLRSLAGMGIMAGHIANAMQQVTGFSVALSKVKAKSIAKGFREYVNNKHLLDDICEMSPFMKSRIEDFAYEYQSRMEQITRTSENFSQAKGLFNKLGAIDAKLDPVRDWVNRHAYFLQVAVQAPVDGIVWTAAYNEALEKGLSTEDAIADADSVVRTTQSDFSPENIANVEAGSAPFRAILVFYNYFGMQANLLGERWQVAKQNKNYGQFALDAMYVAWIPSVLAAVIAQMWTGFDTGDDDEWDLYDTLRLFIAEPLKNVIAMIPFGSALVNSGGAFWAKNTDSPVAKFIWGQDPFVGKPLSSPAVDLVSGAGKALYDVYRLQNGDNVNARTMTRDMLDLGSVVTRLPLGGLKKPLGYAAGVASGDIKSDGAVDTVRGFIAGKEIK